LASISSNDRYKLNLFYQGPGSEIPYVRAQEPSATLEDVEALFIVGMAMDFPRGTPLSKRHEITTAWGSLLPRMKGLRRLSVRQQVSQEFFDVLVKLKNLESLHIWSSPVTSLAGIETMHGLRSLHIERFTKLKSIAPISKLGSLRLLSIENCFKVEDYHHIGHLLEVEGLCLGGDTFAPRRLRLPTLKPFVPMKKLRHLNLSDASVVDGSYDAVLQMPALERLDLSVSIPKEMRQRMLSEHPALKAGFFVDYDFDNKCFKQGKDWSTGFAYFDNE